MSGTRRLACGAPAETSSARPARNAWARVGSWIVVACVLFPATGCTICRNTLRTVVWEPAKYCANIDLVRSSNRYHDWADQAWVESSVSCSTAIATRDYEAGFKYGFVDYCKLGGIGEPPPVPPRKYWRVDWRTNGKELAAQWFDGYRHGASVAMQGGYRELALLQSSVTGFASPHLLPHESPTMLPPGITEQGSPFTDDLPLPDNSFHEPAENAPIEELPVRGPQSSPATGEESKIPPVMRLNSSSKESPVSPAAARSQRQTERRSTDELEVEQIQQRARVRSVSELTKLAASTAGAPTGPQVTKPNRFAPGSKQEARPIAKSRTTQLRILEPASNPRQSGGSFTARAMDSGATR